MSRAVIAEAVLKNILHYFDTTKSQRKGSVISCRNFLLGICFHKHSFPHGTYSLRKLSELTKIDRRVLTSHMKSKEALKNIRYRPFAKGSPSNYSILGKTRGKYFSKELMPCPYNLCARSVHCYVTCSRLHCSFLTRGGK